MVSPEMVGWMEKVSYRMPQGLHMYCRGGVFAYWIFHDLLSVVGPMRWGSCNCFTSGMGWARESKIQYHANSECSRVGKDALEILFKLVLPIFDDVYSGDLVFIPLKWFDCTHMLIALLNRVWNQNWRRRLLHLDAVQFMWRTPESMACQGMSWLD